MERLENGISDHSGCSQTITWTPQVEHPMGHTDLTLIVGCHHFKVHKHILMTSSDFFKAMFSSGMCENDADKVTVQLVEPQPLQVILEGLYSGTLTLDESNAFAVAEAGHLLQIQPAFFCQCTDFLRQMIEDHYCFDVMHFCDSVNLIDVYSDARRYCLANFSRLRHAKSYVDLSLPQLLAYLSDKNLVVDREADVVDAIRLWLEENEEAKKDLSEEMLRTLLASGVCFRNGDKDLECLLELLLNMDMSRSNEDMDYTHLLGRRKRQEDVFMFWSLLNSTNADGLVDVVKLDQESGQGYKFDSMTNVVESPGYDLGSAFCIQSHFVYLSGGGPSFGKMNWIRKIYRFDVSRSQSRWEEVGDLYETRRHHAMVAIGSKLYIFGGFGKFRAKNNKLDSFDLSSGTWEGLPVTPTHEIKPVATSTDEQIIYLDRDHMAHCFNIISKQWTTLVWTRLDLPPPVAIFASNDDPGFLTVVLNGHGHLTLASSQLDANSCSLLSMTKVEREGKFEGCVLANERLFILLGEDEDEEMVGGSQVAAVRRILEFCVQTKTVLSVKDTNVRKALCLLAAPYLPSVFQTGSLRPYSPSNIS